MDVITTHVDADFDGLASMVAAGKLYPHAALVLPGGAQEPVRNFLSVHELALVRLKDIDMSAVRRLIVVDAQEPDRIGPLKDLWERADVEVHLFDHHADEDMAQRFDPHVLERITQYTVEPVGATTTLLVERLTKESHAITPFEATVFALGLYEETGFMAYTSTTHRDLWAAGTVLQAGADLHVVSDTLRRPLDPDLIGLLNDLLRSSETYYLEGRKVLLATSAYDRYGGDLAEGVHRLAEVKRLDAVIAAIAVDDKVQVIGRSRRPEIDVAWIAREFGGGGHSVAAAASVKGQTLIEVKERLAELLQERYRPTLLAEAVMTSPVISIHIDATVEDTERMLTRYSVNVLPVLDANDHYLGLISRETVQKALFHGLHKVPLEQFIQREQYTATTATPFHEIEEQMIGRNQRFVPILSTRNVVGVITRTDLLRTLHDDVLAAARAQSKQSGALLETLLPRRRHLAATLRDRLPAHVLSLLHEAGVVADRLGVSAYVVGGFVRDLLLNLQNLDIDLVIEGDGLEFARALAQSAHARMTLHERFGTAVVVLPDGFKVDVATARTEYYEFPTALPTVEQSSIKKDLYRRDFTINTLAVCLNAGMFGELRDFYGGQRDLKERTIRVLHSLSFIEDPTRVFRAIRFEARFGFRLSKETIALIKGAAKMDLFHRLSGHRLLDELRLLCSEPQPRSAIRRLADLNLLRFIHPKLTWSNRLDQVLRGVEEALYWYKLLYLDRKMEGWLLYMTALLDVLPERAVREAMKRYPFSEPEADRIATARFETRRVARRLRRQPVPRPADTYRALKGLPDEALLYLMAKSKSDSVKRQVSAFFTLYRHVRHSVTGDDLKAMGLKPGPQYTRILSRLLDARLNGEVHTEAEERELAQRFVSMEKGVQSK